MEKAELPTLNGLVETALFVEDVGRGSDFYETVLGLSKVKASDTGCVFRTGNQRYLLIDSRKAAQTPSKAASGDVLPPVALPNMTAADLDTSHSEFPKTPSISGEHAWPNMMSIF